MKTKETKSHRVTAVPSITKGIVDAVPCLTGALQTEGPKSHSGENYYINHSHNKKNIYIVVFFI